MPGGGGGGGGKLNGSIGGISHVRKARGADRGVWQRRENMVRAEQRRSNSEKTSFDRLE